ncbi:MAG: outer membrane lipid asymmetry maintenance protein MlaD [Deltaproteobacteria bacterium]|nr:outer membrane lipid asymmetry maintenance protein MlaD [Deltaproteobacteria bacterium]
MEKRTVEAAVGVFVIIGIVCVGYLTIKLGKMQWFGDDTYTISARFASVSGLKPGAHVEMAGVQIGQVETISLEQKSKVAIVKIKIKKDVTLSDDVIASIATSGLIGDKYIKLSPGGAEQTLKPGDMITETESAVNLEELIGKYVFGGVDKKPAE